MTNVTILDISLRRMPFANFAGGQIYEVSLDDGKTSLSPEKICLVLSPEDVFLADGKS